MGRSAGIPLTMRSTFTILLINHPGRAVLRYETPATSSPLSPMTGRDYDDLYRHRAVRRRSPGTTIAGFGGGSAPPIAAARNIGVMAAATKVYPTAAYWCCRVRASS